MNLQESRAFVETWHTIMLVGAIGMVTLAILLFLIYHFRVSVIKSLKDRHDFINSNEIKSYKWVFGLIGIAVAFAINLYGKDEIGGFHSLYVYSFL